MTPLLLLATSDGLAICERVGAEWKERKRALADHAVTSLAARSDLIVAGTTDGLFRSNDGRGTWACLYECYCRAAWIDPEDSDHILFGPAQSVDSRGRIEETRDGGKTWTPASTGLKTPWRNHMVERFLQAGDELLAVLSNGELISAPLAALEWRRTLPEVEDVAAAAVIGLAA